MTDQLPAETQTEKQTENQYVVKAKEVSSNYLQFILDVLKAPAQAVKNAGQSQWINAVITLCLLALFNSLSTFIQVKRMSSHFSTVDYFIKPFFYMIISLVVASVLIFAFSKLMKSKADILEVAAKFGSLLVIPMLLSLLSILVFFNANLLSIVSSLISIGLIAAVTYTVYTLSNNEAGFDSIYSLFLVMISIGVIAFILSDIISFPLASSIFKTFR